MHFEADTYDLPGPYRIGVLAIRSPVESANIPQLKRTLDAMFENRSWLVVDLAATPYVSSAGWSTFLVHAAADRSRLRVAGMSEAVRDVFHLLGLSVVLEMSPTVGEAVTAIIADASNACSYAGPSDDER